MAQSEMATAKVIVIGGGPAGLMAAGQAALHGADTLLLEKMPRLGMKLCITGKGRCNLTNTCEVAEFIGHFGKNGRFLRQAFARFFNNDLLDFLTELGLKIVKERGGRVFPASGKAPEVQQLLRLWCKKCGVKIESSAPVTKLLITDNQVTGVVSKGRTISCERIILATGGASYPATGSTGDGYPLAESAGHTTIPIRQGLVPLETAGKEAGRMAELNLRNIKVRMFVDNKKKKEAFGEVVFTPFGLTGPTILTLSGDAVDYLRAGHRVELALDLKPALDGRKLEARLLRDIDSRGKEEITSFLRGLIPRQMIPVCLDHTKIPTERRVCDISAKERKALRGWLKDLRFNVTGYRPFSEAIITAGGINTKEIDPKTMESKKTKGLFIAGELLDIQADTGGFNLQAAFSTGWLAGRNAAGPSSQ